MTDSLVVRGVSQRFGDRVVLDDVDLDVPAGKVIGLLGPNGAGKTTLMRIIFGVLDPDDGTIDWRGRRATADDRRSWGYMPQERGLYRDMRVADHLVWIARLHGLEREDANARALDLLGRLGLEDRARDTIRDLSGGMAQRVQLAVAMVHGPDLIGSTSRSPGSTRALSSSCHRSCSTTSPRDATCSSRATNSTSSRISAKRSP